MTVFMQAAAGVMLASVLGLALSHQGKELSVVLTVAVCCMVLILAVSFLNPVMEFLQTLESLAQLDEGLIKILFKTIGIALVTEIAGMVCADAGNASMGKALHILGTSVMLWLAIPVFQGLLDLIGNVLGGI